MLSRDFATREVEIAGMTASIGPGIVETFGDRKRQACRTYPSLYAPLKSTPSLGGREMTSDAPHLILGFKCSEQCVRWLYLVPKTHETIRMFLAALVTTAS